MATIVVPIHNNQLCDLRNKSIRILKSYIMDFPKTLDTKQIEQIIKVCPKSIDLNMMEYVFASSDFISYFI